uniref:Uncharacterized protein n=1 Tax=Setaria digitata TaxID=48799 RepID=A0A915Q2A7_9BILA
MHVRVNRRMPVRVHMYVYALMYSSVHVCMCAYIRMRVRMSVYVYNSDSSAIIPCRPLSVATRHEAVIEVWDDGKIIPFEYPAAILSDQCTGTAPLR